MRHKKPAEINMGVDLDGSIIDKFNYSGHMEFFNQSCFDFLDNLPADTDTFIYVDPPYLFETRKSQRPMYKYEFTKADHIRLLEMLSKLNCMVCISGYDSDLYNKMLSGWRKVIYYQYDRQSRKREEILWCNYPEPEQLHDYSFLGDNFSDRQRIKRKINRHVDRLKSLPVLERQAILNAIRDLA